MDGSGEARKTSPWVYVAIGCAIPLLLVAALAGVTAYWTYRTAKQFTDSNPATRTEQAKEVLGFRELPEGYHATMTISIPFLFEMTMLSDIEPDFKDKHKPPFGKQGFIYVKTIRSRKGHTLQDYADGKADDSELFSRGEIHLGERKEIGRGMLALGDSQAFYVASHGSLSAHGQPFQGIVSLVAFECPQDKRSRIGIWFGPEPEAKEGVEVSYTGTQADPERIREFVSQFTPCAH